MPALEKEWTAEMVRAIPDDLNQYQVVDGELFVTLGPAWRHGDVLLELHLLFAEYLKKHPFAHIKLAPQDVELDIRTLVQPDLFVVPLLDGRKPRTWDEAGRMLLAVEVLSPSTARLDRSVKRQRYQRERVPEYWIVDMDARLIERWKPDDERPEIMSSHIDWEVAPGVEKLEIDLPAFFARALD
jgi:Uma2 family endonuclease